MPFVHDGNSERAPFVTYSISFFFFWVSVPSIGLLTICRVSLVAVNHSAVYLVLSPLSLCCYFVPLYN